MDHARASPAMPAWAGSAVLMEMLACCACVREPANTCLCLYICVCTSEHLLHFFFLLFLTFPHALPCFHWRIVVGCCGRQLFDEIFSDSQHSEVSFTRSRSASVTSRHGLTRTDSLLSRPNEDLDLIRASKCARAKVRARAPVPVPVFVLREGNCQHPFN